MFRSILVPVDGSEHARKALLIAQRLVDPGTGKIHLLNVAEPPRADDVIGRATGASPMHMQPEDYENAARELLCGERDRAGLPEDVPEIVVRTGEPAKVMLAEADRLRVDAVVMGSRGMSDWKGLMMGSVSHKVSHLANCTVLTVH